MRQASEPNISAAARARFLAQFGQDPLGIWSAPGRVNLIGEHTDYNAGFVLPCAINRRTSLAVGERSDRQIVVASTLSSEVREASLDQLGPETMAGWSAYVFGVIWAFGQLGVRLEERSGVNLTIASDVPIGAGLSSSAAIECAIAIAMNELWELGLDRAALAKVGQLAENQAVGAPTGIMDQSASMLGTAEHAVFLDCRSLHSEPVRLGFADAGLELLVIDTKVSHSHATGGYAARRASCERGASALGVATLRELELADLPRAHELLDEETFRRVRHVVNENQRVQETVERLRTTGPLSIGELLNASHESMRDDFEISCRELDLAVSTAQDAGAIGARMTGGGFGGAAIALVHREQRSTISAAIHAAFTAAGLESPNCFAVIADDGSRRDE